MRDIGWSMKEIGWSMKDTGSSMKEIGSSMKTWQGYAVETPVRRLGVVDTVLFADDAAQPSALSVRRGRFARGVRIIDAADIEGIDDRARRIAVRSDGVEITF
jgi:hypothetical protein